MLSFGFARNAQGERTHGLLHAYPARAAGRRETAPVLQRRNAQDLASVFSAARIASATGMPDGRPFAAASASLSL
jgi:hypothetical protein